MDFLRSMAEIVLHIDVFIDQQVGLWGLWMYLILFAIIFCETGFVVTPFLPGDSLLFAAGAVAARPGNPLNVWVLMAVLCVAAVAGDTANYWIGHSLGSRWMKNPNSKILRKEHLDRTHAFFGRYGGKTIILARFVPIVRTFAPFLAGVGEMSYGKFVEFNVVGGVLWIGGFLFAGFFFGKIPQVEQNLTLVLVAVVVVTTIPIVVEYFRSRRQAAEEAAAAVESESA